MTADAANTLFTFPEGYPALLEQIGHVLGRKLLELGIDHAKANAHALAMLDAIRKEVGGTMVYVSKGQSYDMSARDDAIYAKFRGNNYTQLARLYQLTDMQIRNIVKRGRARDVARKQARLF